MTNVIKTAEEILDKYTNCANNGGIDRVFAKEAMMEFAKQFIDLAVEKATATSLIEDELSGEEVESDFGWAEVDKESILKIKELIK